MSEHKTTRMSELNDGQGADIDNQLVPMVKFLNRLGVRTITCCQGDPGEIGDRDPVTGEWHGGRYGHVAFIGVKDTNDFNEVAAITFGLLRSMVAHLYNSVSLSIVLSEELCSLGKPSRPAFEGWMYFRNECIEEVTKRLGIYCEMNHK